MKNQLVAQILNEVADMLDMEGVEFKPRAYRRAARTIESLAEPIEQIYAEGKLEDLPGVGEAIAKKIEEIIETGSLKYRNELKAKTPVDLEGILAVEGIGPKTAGVLFKRLGIKSLDDLERAAKEHKIREIKRLGPKTEENILSSIELAKTRKVRTLLGDALPVAEEICQHLRTNKKAEATQVEAAGSLRRMKETIGDIDILATSRHSIPLSEAFTSMSGVRKILEKGETKSSIILESNLQVDLRIIDEQSFGSAMMYFTGSKDHNIALRKLAISKGLKLSEYGLFKGNERVASHAEEVVYKRLGLDYIPPELREDHGEVDAAMNHELPDLIPYDAMQGDLHAHTKWSDGQRTIEEMAQAAKALGYSYIAITDHYSTMPIVNGLNEQRLREQMKEIDHVNEKLEGIEVLKGAEVDIAPDGALKGEKSVLKELDLVVGSVHGTFKQTKREMTQRLITTMESGLANIIGHPTSRKINEKNPCEIDFDQIFEASKRSGTYLEINSSPHRLDLDDANANLALKAGCKLAIDTDAHDRDELRNIRLGIGVARRGWLRRADVINTLPLEKLRKILKRN
ncbi:MAG: DNA polymerase/3'-5' exonuclease PolX [Candidatus Bathyarchaeia archaeon]|jgi:DNA polymerase (family 10)